MSTGAKIFKTFRISEWLFACYNKIRNIMKQNDTGVRDGML